MGIFFLILYGRRMHVLLFLINIRLEVGCNMAGELGGLFLREKISPPTNPCVWWQCLVLPLHGTATSMMMMAVRYPNDLNSVSYKVLCAPHGPLQSDLGSFTCVVP